MRHTVSEAINGIDVRALADQKLDDVQVALRGSQVKGSTEIIITTANVNSS